MPHDSASWCWQHASLFYLWQDTRKARCRTLAPEWWSSLELRPPSIRDPQKTIDQTCRFDHEMGV